MFFHSKTTFVTVNLDKYKDVIASQMQIQKQLLLLLILIFFAQKYLKLYIQKQLLLLLILHKQYKKEQIKNSKTTFVTVNQLRILVFLNELFYSKTTFVTVNRTVLPITQIKIRFKNNFCYC